MQLKRSAQDVQKARHCQKFTKHQSAYKWKALSKTKNQKY